MTARKKAPTSAKEPPGELTEAGYQYTLGGEFTKRTVPPTPIRRDGLLMPEDVEGGLFAAPTGKDQ